MRVSTKCPFNGQNVESFKIKHLGTHRFEAKTVYEANSYKIDPWGITWCTLSRDDGYARLLPRFCRLLPGFYLPRLLPAFTSRRCAHDPLPSSARCPASACGFAACLHSSIRTPRNASAWPV